MIKTIRIALAQINPTVGNISLNVSRIGAYIDAARRQQANVVLFPELAITGYPPEDLVLRDDFVRASMAGLQQVARATHGLVAIVGSVEKVDGHVYNAAGICADGKLVTTYHKICLPNYGVFDERRYFVPGNTPLVLVWEDLRIGVNICEDIWTSERIAEFQATAGGAQLLINISASPYHFRKGFEREQLVAETARRAQAFFVYVNMVGGQDELVFDGQALIHDPEGQLLLRSEQFEEKLIVADLEIPVVARRPDPSLQERFRLQEVRLPLPFQAPARPFLAPQVAPVRDDLDEVFSALVLGTRDYVHKNGFRQVALGLSGGVDSALTAAIAAAAVGRDNVIGVLMPGQFTAPASNEDAEALARNLEIRTLALPIQDIFAAFATTLAPAFAGRPRDLTEENLQARIRGALLMALSNKFGWLVLATSNKSETAVGYTTLYGDMVGGFAVLKDVPKTLVYPLSRWVNQHAFGRPIIPERTLTRAPTAELRANQTDQDSLPPYELLDRIIEDYVEDDRSMAEMVARGLPPEVVSEMIKLIDRSEYKRQQAAPGIKISTKNFGKDRRMPITNGFKPYNLA